jgi:GAF domain-containing protein
MRLFSPPSQSEAQDRYYASELIQLREQVLRIILVSAVVVGVFVFFFSEFTMILQQSWILVGLYALVFGWLATIAVSNRISYNFKLYSFFAILFTLGLISLVMAGLTGDGRIYFLTLIVVMSLFAGNRTTVIGIAATFATLILIGGASFFGWLHPASSSALSSSDLLINWSTASVSYVLLVTVIFFSLSLIIQNLERTIASQKLLSAELDIQKKEMEDHVQLRTKELQTRATQLEVASQIAHSIALEKNVEPLLNKSVNLIRDQFGFYHAGIFLLDEKNEYAVLKAATGDAGSKLLAQGHKLKSGEQGIVGYVTATGEPRIALDVGVDAVHFKNPFLPYTRSEMALPLKIESRVIGALDVQSEKEAAFTLEDIKILQTLTDQLAVALERTRLMNELQESVEELHARYREFTQQTWETHLKKAPLKYSYHYAEGKVAQENMNLPSMKGVQVRGTSILRNLPNEQDPTKETSIITVPIKLRDQTLGTLNLRFNTPDVSADIIGLVQSTTDRLALALENARLLEELQERAEQEHLVSDISSKVRKSISIDDILRTTVTELGKSLGISEVQIQLTNAEKQK